jgi:hypothetical protein
VFWLSHSDSLKLISGEATMLYDSDRHLYQPPLYGSGDGQWRGDFLAATKAGADFTWDHAAIACLLSYSFASCDRTLVSEIQRKPWLSSLSQDGEIEFGPIPRHDTLVMSAPTAAKELGRLLEDELVQVCQKHDDVYVLLSGGLDSRIVAGTIAKAVGDGRIRSRVRAVTWGMETSRDVVYAGLVANQLGIELLHVDLTSEHLLENINASADYLGALVSGVHLHRMLWFRNLPPGSIVIAGSYGDSVGRAEFSGRHVLELGPLKLKHRYRLLKPGVWAVAQATIDEDVARLHGRTPAESDYILREHEQQGIYMRNMIAHAMTVINGDCLLYQAFTAPEVFSFMWALHPSIRTNSIYARLLESLNPDLARIPWARTNRALSGRTFGARTGLDLGYHEYSKWAGGSLFEEILQRIDMPWLANTGIFDIAEVESLAARVRGGMANSHEVGNFVWLATFRRFGTLMEERGGTITSEVPTSTNSGEHDQKIERPSVLSPLRKRLGRVPLLTNVYKKIRLVRRIGLKASALVRHRPRISTDILGRG